MEHVVLIGILEMVISILEETDMTPTSQLINAVKEADKGFNALLKK